MELPPVLQMITTEIPPNKLLRGNVVRLLKDKGFLKEISAQANFSVKRKVAHGRKSSAKDDTLKIYPTPALNPLSSFGKCIEHNCRVIQAESFARSIGLYCDHAEVTDFITPSFLTPDASKMDAGQLFSDMQCLTVLMPMIRAGIIRFSDPIEDMCAQCCKEVSGDLSEKLWQFVLKDGQAEFEAYEGKLSCNVSSSFFDTDGVSLFTDYYLDAEEAKAVPFLFRKVKIKNLPENALKLVKKRTTNDLLLGIHQVSEAAKSAADKAAILVTNSRQDAAILRKIDSGSVKVV